MILPSKFFDAISAYGVEFYTGVPDSLLINFCTYLEENGGANNHLITANEGNAIALGMGYHMSTGKIPMIYMQNSGLGNAINPLTSLTDSQVYKIPMLLLIGFRGEPGVKDEPQHIKQGQITLKQLDLLGIPHWILNGNSNVESILDEVFTAMRHTNSPVALVVRKDTFAKHLPEIKKNHTHQLSREEALNQLIKLFDEKDLVISTTGKTSRELFELRAKEGQAQRDFLMVGGMGHTSSLALGVAIGQPSRRVICLDGDGSLLMHMGSIPVIAEYKPQHFIHILLNNGSHESVGGQKTVADRIDFEKLASAVGYVDYGVAIDTDSIQKAWHKIARKDGPVMLEIKIKNGSRDNLGRPTEPAEKNKHHFMKFIGT